MSGFKHDWEISGKTTTTGKILLYCKVCGIEDTAPVKAEFEHRECIAEREGAEEEEEEVE